jgi:hypothetical protein
MARAGVEACAPDKDEDEGKLCAESAAAAATTSHNRAAGKTFIVFECGREFGFRSSSDREDRSSYSDTRYSNPIKQPSKKTKWHLQASEQITIL